MTIARRRSTNPLNTFLQNNPWIEKFDDILTPLVTVAILLTLWQIFASFPGATLPSPIKVIQETWILILYPFYDRGGTDKGLFLQVFASTLRRKFNYR